MSGYVVGFTGSFDLAKNDIFDFYFQRQECFRESYELDAATMKLKAPGFYRNRFAEKEEKLKIDLAISRATYSMWTDIKGIPDHVFGLDSYSELLVRTATREIFPDQALNLWNAWQVAIATARECDTYAAATIKGLHWQVVQSSIRDHFEEQVVVSAIYTSELVMITGIREAVEKCGALLKSKYPIKFEALKLNVPLNSSFLDDLSHSKLYKQIFCDSLDYLSIAEKVNNADLCILIGEKNFQANLLSINQLITSVLHNPRNLTEQYSGFSSLLDHVMEPKKGHFVATTYLDPNKLWFVNEHKLGDKYIMVSTAYVEIALQMIRRITSNQQILLKDFIIHNTLIIGPDTRIFTEIDSADQTLCIYTRKRSEKVVYADARFELLEKKDSIPDINIDALKENYQPLEVMPHEVETMTLGPRWNLEREGYQSESSRLQKLRLDSAIASDTETFCFHPALMDTAINNFSTPKNTGPFIPMSYGSVHCLAAVPEEVWSLSNTRQLTDETIAVEVRLFSTSGKLLVHLEDYILTKSKLSIKSEAN